MDRAELLDLAISNVKDFTLSARGVETKEVTDATCLFGKDGLLDSLGLVSIVLDIEQQINTRLGTSISLADDRAMSQTRSPFRTVGTLADYALTLIQEQLGS